MAREITVSIGLDASEQRSTLLRAGSRNSAHGRDNCLQLADILDLRDDIGEPLGHHGALCSGCGWQRRELRHQRGEPCLQLGALGIVEASGSFDLIDNGRAMLRSSQPGSSDRNFPICSSGKRSSRPSCNAKHERNFVRKPQWRVLGLREDCADTLPTRDLALDLDVGDAAEPREHLKFQELGVVEPHRLRRLSQRRRLCLAADAAHACPDVDRRLVALVEQSRIEQRSGRR